MLKKAWLLPLSWLIAMSASASTAAPLKIANVIIPASFAKALEEGLAVPVRLRYTDEDNRIDTLTDDTIGNATLLLQDGKLHLLHLDFSAGQQQGVLNDALTTLLSSKQRRTFSADGDLQIDADASMQLDLVAMLLTIRVSRDAFGQARQSDNRVALTPTVDTLTGVQRYNLGYSFINTPRAGTRTPISCSWRVPSGWARTMSPWMHPFTTWVSRSRAAISTAPCTSGISMIAASQQAWSRHGTCRHWGW